VISCRAGAGRHRASCFVGARPGAPLADLLAGTIWTGIVDPRIWQAAQRANLGRPLSEWRLIAATHNLLKLHRHTLAATTA
jgi:hypothetical protein